MSRDIKYIGMDVHQEAIVIAVLNGSGKLVMETIVETKASSILQFIHGLRGELHVTWEEGTWAAWLYREMARSSACAHCYAPKSLDTADIVREAIFLQQPLEMACHLIFLDRQSLKWFSPYFLSCFGSCKARARG